MKSPAAGCQAAVTLLLGGGGSGKTVLTGLIAAKSGGD